MAEAKTPTADAGASRMVSELSRASSEKLYSTVSDAKTSWNPGGAIKFPLDETEAEILDAALRKLSTEFNVKVPGRRGSDGSFEPAPLEELPEDRRRRNGPRLHPKHLPAAVMTEAAKTAVTNWKAQKRTRCGEPGCYHPITPKRLERVNFEPIKFPAEDGGFVTAGECAYEPRHAGGLQFIPDRKISDE